MRSPFWRLWTYPHSSALKLGWLQNHLLEQLGRNILRHQGKKSSTGAELLGSCLKSWSCQADLYPLVCRCSPSPQELRWLQSSCTDHLDETLCTLTLLCQTSLSSVLSCVLIFKHLLLSSLFHQETLQKTEISSLPVPLYFLWNFSWTLQVKCLSSNQAVPLLLDYTFPQYSAVHRHPVMSLLWSALQGPAILAMIWILPVTQGLAMHS